MWEFWPGFPGIAHASQRESCYASSMAKKKQPAAKTSKAGTFVLGKRGFAKISAVEGIRLTGPMEKRATDARARKLSAKEYREEIMRSHRKS
jgi:hypothetical protein